LPFSYAENMKRSVFNVILVSFATGLLAVAIVAVTGAGAGASYLILLGLGTIAMFFLLGTDLKNPRVGDELRHVGFRRRPDE
jgi:hypothetical protein